MPDNEGVDAIMGNALPAAPYATYSIGVRLFNGQMATYIRKGDKLPTRQMMHHVIVRRLRAGNAEDVVSIPLLEGEHARAERNYSIGAMEISGADITQDLPQGTQIEITVAMDQSQQITLHAFIERFGQDFAIKFNPVTEGESLDRLIHQCEQQKVRLKKVRVEVEKTKPPGANEILRRIDGEELVDQLRKLQASAAHDLGARSAFDRRLREFAALIDDLEDVLKWPKLVEEANAERADAQKLVEAQGKDDDKRRLRGLMGELQQAIDVRDPNALRRTKYAFIALYFYIRDRDPKFHVALFEHLKHRKPAMEDQRQADLIVAQGERALKNNDIEALKTANRQLRSLLAPIEVGPNLRDPRISTDPGVCDTLLVRTSR